MGMFDYVNYECVCPVCKTKVDGFQSKDGECTLSELSPSEVDNFYSSCSKCGCWLEFRAKPVVRENFTREVYGKDKNGKRVELTEHRKELFIQE